MQNVLADLILETEATTAFTMRLARALDQSHQPNQSSQHRQAQHLVRMGTAIGKYWICKRTPGHIYEAMECIGGSGVMEDCIMPRLFRESPINAIWEGSGNVQCLDMNDEPIAAGLVNYPATDIIQIMGQQSHRIKDILGYSDSEEIIHRNNLVIL